MQMEAAGVTQAFLPHLIRSRGAIVNILLDILLANALAPLPLIPAYSISKAAAFNMTQSMRALLAERGVRVHAVLTGPVDTDMTRIIDILKASPESVARGIVDAVEKGEEDIFPDPTWLRTGGTARSRRSSASRRRSRKRPSPL